MSHSISTTSGTVHVTKDVEIGGVSCLEATDGSLWVAEGAAFVNFEADRHGPKNSITLDALSGPVGSEAMTEADLAELMGDDPDASNPGGEQDGGDSGDEGQAEDDDVVPAKRRRRTNAQIEADNAAAAAAEGEGDSE